MRKPVSGFSIQSIEWFMYEFAIQPIYWFLYERNITLKYIKKEKKQ